MPSLPQAERAGDGWTVRVPASSANLGPGFDALAVAVTRWITVRPARAGEEEATESHPAVQAFRAFGGRGPLAVAATFPGGRGLGFSGAARVAGVLAARAQQGVDAPGAVTPPATTTRRQIRDPVHARPRVDAPGGESATTAPSPAAPATATEAGAVAAPGLPSPTAAAMDEFATSPALDTAVRAAVDAATQMEGHADNVAASAVGGVVAVAGGRVVRVPLAREVAVVVWIPDHETATASSRLTLPASVAFDDAVFNVGRTALLVAALAAGDVGALRAATEDRLHQDHRLARVRASREALRAALDAGAWGAWLSGSGPSVAAFADPDRATTIARALPLAGRAEVLGIDDRGAVVEWTSEEQQR